VPQSPGSGSNDELERAEEELLVALELLRALELLAALLELTVPQGPRSSHAAPGGKVFTHHLAAQLWPLCEHVMPAV